MKKVLLGMSGGIDSSLSAVLLREQGFEVTGATMSVWDGRYPAEDWPRQGCFGPQEAEHIERARLVCAQLGIPHHVIRLGETYSREVLAPFCDTYAQGRTPNPCVRCNPLVKFGAFPDLARAQGIEFDYFATGHYSRKTWSDEHQLWQLLRGVDESKDQSYFLAFLSQAQLARTLFPLGGFTKREVRQLALDKGFDALHAQPESQDFIPQSAYPRIFSQDAFQPGEIVDPAGNILGTHRGLPYYTIGQRKHLGVSGREEPYYVTGIDAERNRVTVGPQAHLYSSELKAGGLNWLSVPAPQSPFRAEAKIRLAHHPAPCLVEPSAEGGTAVRLDAPQMSVTPGQAVVFYTGDIVLGGGIIS